MAAVREYRLFTGPSKLPTAAINLISPPPKAPGLKIVIITGMLTKIAVTDWKEQKIFNQDVTILFCYCLMQLFFCLDQPGSREQKTDSTDHFLPVCCRMGYELPRIPYRTVILIFQKYGNFLDRCS